MIQVDNIEQLRVLRRDWQKQDRSIGFVPTMGNLHAGHLSLVRAAKAQTDVVVVSIFVNPMQFGANEDLDAYPRTLQADMDALSELGVDMVFTPTVEAIYPRGLEQQTFVEVPGISAMICGASRPGHFRGVATIVCKLFNMVQPNHSFFGSKDYQQVQVIRTMVSDLSMNLQIHAVETEREASGLAMSSRNQYLTEQQRQQAANIYRILCDMTDGIELGRRDFNAMCADAGQQLQQLGFTVDYVEIRNARTLMPVGVEDTELVVLIAAFLGKTRLIDNKTLSLQAD